MNLEDLFIPAIHSHVMSRLIDAKKAALSQVEGNGILVSESDLVTLFLAAGAFVPGKNEKMSENEWLNPDRDEFDSKIAVNEGVVGAIPQVIVEERCNPEGNLVRAVMEHKNLALKTVAERYGGKSGPANVANFMARSNAELRSMRASTRRKLADALGCPEDWLIPHLEESADE